MKTLFAILISFGVVGCGAFPQKTNLLEKQKEEFEIIEINRPKHFGLTIKSIRTGEIHKVSVSKHFGDWQKIKIGSKINATWEKWEWSNGETRISFDSSELRKECERLVSENKNDAAN